MQPRSREDVCRHRRLALVLTAIETAVLMTVAGNAFKNPLLLILHPIGSLKGHFSRNLLFIASGELLLATRVLCWDCKAPLSLLFCLVLASQLLFTSYFSRCMQSFSCMVPTRISINTSFAYSIMLALSSALLLTYSAYLLNGRPVYTRTRGLFNYLTISSREFLRNATALYLLGSAISLGLIGMHVFFFRFVLSFMHFLIPFCLASERLSTLLKNIIMLNIASITYYLTLNVVDGLLVYNSSLLSDFGDYSYDSSESPEDARLRFFQMSERSMVDAGCFRKIAKSRHAIASIEAYMQREKEGMLELLRRLSSERRLLESKIWLSVPQIVSHPERPRGMAVQKKQQFVKKIKSYNFIEIFVSRLVYAWRERILMSEYRNSIAFIESIMVFMRHIEKYREDYLLLTSLKSAFDAEMKEMHDKAEEMEKELGTDLGSARLKC
jgi:hypothetical protein